MRKKKNFDARWSRVAPLLADDPAALRGQWRSLCPGTARLHVELGCGKGQFLSGWAEAHPDTLCIGLERVPEALLMAMEKARARELSNIRFIRGDAGFLDTYFAPGEANRIFVHFCDPWPSQKRAARRLTHRDFLLKYKRALAPDGAFAFKTDNAPLFSFSLKELEAVDADILFSTEDWHRDPAFPGSDLMTEYESRFSEQGIPICRLEAKWTK